MRFKTRLNLLIVSVFVLLTVLLSAWQLYVVESLVIDRVARNMEQNIRGAWRVLDNRLERMRTVVALVAGEDTGDNGRLEALRADRRWGLDLLVRIAPGATGEPSLPGYLLGRYGGGPSGVSGVARVPLTVLSAEERALADRARMAGGVDAAMFAFAAAPCGNGDRVVAATLLNGAQDVVEAIQADLFRDRFYRDRRVGTATIFLGPVRVATTVLRDDGRSAVGTRVSDEVAEQVLVRGASWTGRANVVGTWYISRYDPVRDPAGEIIGMLYIGELERVYTDIRFRTLALSLGALLALMGLALGVSVTIADRTVGQVAALDRATRAFAAGDYAARAPATTRDEVGQLAAAFNEMAGRIEDDRKRIVRQREETAEANRNYIDLLSFVTHELRSSLAAAQLNVDLLKRGSFGTLRGDQAEGVRAVDDTLRRLNDSTLNYLQLSRIEEGHRMLNRREVDLRRDVIEPVTEALEPQLREADMHLDNGVPRGLVVAGDSTLLRIVYQNLLGNAVKFGRPGGRIALGANRGEGRVVLTVWNEGEGMAPEHMPQLFRKFRHFDVGTGTGRSGTGVGLFIVKQIIEQHGGEIAAESEPGAWARFRFHLLT